MPERIAIVGAGHVGAALAARCCAAGFEVRLGVRDPAKGRDVANRCGTAATATTVGEAGGWADLLFLCVPADAAVAAAREAGELAGVVLVDCTNPVAWTGDGPVWTPPPEGSVAAALVAALPRARVVKGFNAFGASTHADPVVGGLPAEVFLASDDGGAVEIAGRVATELGFSPISAGPLRNAALLEAMAVLWIQLATSGGQGRDFVFRLAR